MEIQGTNLTMTRGNSDSVTLSITENGVAAPFVTGDVVKLSLKSNINDSTPILTKTISSFTNGKAVIDFLPNDTANLQAKEYKYDAKVTYANGRVRHFIKVSTFTLLPTVS